MLAYPTVIIGFLCLLDGSSAQQGVLTVTLAVFSGRPDPQWQVQPSNPKYKDIQTRLGNARKGSLTYRPEDMPGRLGYKGFLVKKPNTKNQAELIVGVKTAQLQKLLLDTMPKDKIPKLRKGVLKEINAGVAKVGPKRTKRYAPPYEPARWNGADIGLNNCYNYANDRSTLSFAQPGRGSGREFNEIIANEVRDAAIRDGLAPFPSPVPGVPPRAPAPSDPRHLVALVVAPNEDFHWYRLDNTGKWSHKPGQGQATNLDGARNEITNPRNAQNGFIPYVFVCYMTTDRNTVNIN